MRLVRVVCRDCQAPDSLAEKTFTRLLHQAGNPTLSLGEGAVASSPTFVRGKGCPECNTTGYHGRTGLFELLVLRDELRESILEGSSSGLYKVALTLGMRTMLIDGLEKSARGVTTIDEVLRVIGESEDA